MMTRIPRISVIVPVYKTPEPFLRACIESLQGQTVQDAQIILVDDGSPDQCGAICEEYAAADERILVVHQENGGPSKARNNGLLHARGRYLTMVDSDDVLFPQAWEKTIEALERTNAQCAVFGWINNESGTPWDYKVTEQETVISARQAMQKIAGENDLCGGGYPWNKVWDADAIRAACGGELPLFDCSLFSYEDKYWILKALQDLEQVVLLPDVLYDYRFVPGSLTNSPEAWYRRQFNAYEAYDRICDYLQSVDRAAYRAGLCKYFRFAFIDMKNMYSWRKDDLDWWKRTKQSVLKVCKRIRPGDLKKPKHYVAWLFCLLYCRF